MQRGSRTLLWAITVIIRGNKNSNDHLVVGSNMSSNFSSCLTFDGIMCYNNECNKC